ncbi:hypothetical protein ASPZODRAFT_62889 [Penicilliopsis zonata CBS 506.65]|uniref:Zn(2)-C6 fungal-type domain-containing protein n=1 Tax=Penicilliopsis zonata CBS 506.65 TaxID=1073090 RepID=A0A1L9SLQ2_9EURO|nr:hypothetical protein ASPZODRAFT_62889 [Penicilliopsis zonata CBS 506.65]OJJ48145.1 hypothetical protein ASPZODRAFT_62889 [Penicilliopsis zonata CBS 506.65]
MTKVSRACTQCRRRKVKCTGETPCRNCIDNRLGCRIDEENDGRRRLSAKRKIESLQQDRDLLLGLLEILRGGSSGRVAEVLDVIRLGDSAVEALRAYLFDGGTRPKRVLSSSSSSLSPSLRSRSISTDWPVVRPKVMDVKRLADKPLYDVPAQPWTSVTTDDHFVSHLVSLWFTWHGSSLFNLVNRDLFLNSMCAGDPEPPFCSSFLVNAILAEACAYSDYAESYSIYNDLATKGAHFYQEAKRLLDLEEGRSTLTTMQGLGVMYTCSTFMGKDRVGWMYVTNAVESARELCAMRDLGGTEHAVRDATMGLFNSAGALKLHKMPPMKKKPLCSLVPECHDPADLWTPYPLPMDSLPVHTSCIFNHLVDLTEISYDTTSCLFGEDRLPLAQLEVTARSLSRRLSTWYAALPDCIQGTNRGSSPGTLNLQMYYHTIIMTLYGFLRHPEPSMPALALANAASARARCVESARTVAQLVHTHHVKWGGQQVPAVYVHWITVALFTLLEELDQAECRAAFLSLSRSAQSLWRRWPLSIGTFRLVQLSAERRAREPRGKELPGEVAEVFAHFEREVWKTHQGRLRFSSLYPNLAEAVITGPGGCVELDQLLQQYDR